MRIKFYGTRGTVPVCSPEFQEFGGDTTCILCEALEQTVILDAGTGIRKLGRELVKDPELGKERDCFLAFSHFHWDHIQGLPFFDPAYDSSRHFTIAAIGKERFGKNIKGIFEQQMQRDYFPVSMDEMGAEITFLQTEDDLYKDREASAQVMKHNHPGDAYSLRIKDIDGKILVICTDIEHGEKIDERIVKLANGADLLIHEGQYTPEELENHRGWGHSSWFQAAEVAQQAGVKQLVVTHHDPDHDDEFLKGVEMQCQQIFKDSMLARVGMEIEI
jgi:phosphoribosyl 1,2-cyclic phosphodiesterase